MKIHITGATGMIGSCVTAEALDRGHQSPPHPVPAAQPTCPLTPA
ncbi:hypothetical protein [Micromonospora sp. KC721]|nr:hypothetical protein [Micromonospora sp. KC721]